MGLFNYDNDFSNSGRWEKMTHKQKIEEIKNSILSVLNAYPEVIDDLEIEIRKMKINKIQKRNEVRTVSKRRPRTNLPPSDSSNKP